MDFTKLPRISDRRTPREEEEDEDVFVKALKGQAKSRLERKIEDRLYTEISDSERISAHMTQASYINLTEGTLASQMYAKQHLPNWAIDTSKIGTTEHGMLFIEKNTGEMRLGMRGTQTLYDWKTNARLATMQESGSKQLQALDQQIEEIKQKYGRNIDILSGHSKGGGQAIFLGEKYGIDTHTQDPALPSRHVFGGKTKAKHKITRTPTDWVSAHTNLAKFRHGITVHDLKPTGTSLLESHGLNVMTGINYKGNGSVAYSPELKNKAFLLAQRAKGHTLEHTAQQTGASLQELRNIETEIDGATPASHAQILRNAGYVTGPRDTHSLKARAIAATMKAGGRATSGVGSAVSNLGSFSGGASMLSGASVGVGTSLLLSEMGIHDQSTQALVSGATSNVAADQAEALVRAHLARRGAGRVSALARPLARPLVQSAGATAGRTASSLGASLGRSMMRGGASGIIGFGVEQAVATPLRALGVDEDSTDILSATAGGAASGAVFGPEGALIGAAIGLGVSSISALIRSGQPHADYILNPFTNEAIDQEIGNSPAVRTFMDEFNRTADFSDDSIRVAEHRLSALVRQEFGGRGSGYDQYTAHLDAVPRGYANAERNLVLPGDYRTSAERLRDDADLLAESDLAFDSSVPWEVRVHLYENQSTPGATKPEWLVQLERMSDAGLLEPSAGHSVEHAHLPWMQDVYSRYIKAPPTGGADRASHSPEIREQLERFHQMEVAAHRTGQPPPAAAVMGTPLPPKGPAMATPTKGPPMPGPKTPLKSPQNNLGP